MWTSRQIGWGGKRGGAWQAGTASKTLLLPRNLCLSGTSEKVSRTWWGLQWRLMQLHCIYSCNKALYIILPVITWMALVFRYTHFRNRPYAYLHATGRSYNKETVILYVTLTIDISLYTMPLFLLYSLINPSQSADFFPITMTKWFIGVLRHRTSRLQTS